MCGDSCVINVGDMWSCEGQCIPSDLSCGDQCPPGRVMTTFGTCQDPADICQTSPECITDSDCQPGGVTFKKGKAVEPFRTDKSNGI